MGNIFELTVSTLTQTDKFMEILSSVHAFCIFTQISFRQVFFHFDCWSRSFIHSNGGAFCENGSKLLPLTIFARRSFLDICQGSE